MARDLSQDNVSEIQSSASASITPVCTKCGGELVPADQEVSCSFCGAVFSHRRGVTDFLERGEVNPALEGSLRLFDQAGAQGVLDDRQRSNIGILGFNAGAVLDLAILGVAVLFAATGSQVMLGVLLALLAFSLVDYIVFKTRRGRILREYEEMPLSIETPGEWDVVNAISGDHPTMQDNVGGAGQAGVDTFTQDKWDERYRVCAGLIDDENRRDGCIVLDAGAGEGHLHQFIEFPCTYVAVDVIDDLLVQIKEQIPGSVPLKAAAHSIPLADQSVDYLVCSESLEHVPDPTGGLTEYSRIIKNDGRIVLTFPNAHRLRNPNLFHIVIDLIAGRVFNSFLQPVVMHPNMWTNALTHHYDFTTRMVRRMAAKADLKIEKLGSIYFPIPYQGPLRRMSYVRFFEKFLAKIPLIRFFGSSMLVVLSRKDTAG